MFQDNVHIGSGTRRMMSIRTGEVSRRRRQTQMTQEEVKDILEDLKIKVKDRYTVALAALRRVKDTFERSFAGPPSLPRPGHWRGCCSSSGPPGPLPPGLSSSNQYSYEARYQDFVNVTAGCVGTSSTVLAPLLQQIDDTFRVMKENYNNDTGLLWQYVATLNGHFLQFPSKNRNCDQQYINNIFTQGWLVDKLLQQKFNVVILLDAGQKMSTIVPDHPGPPVTHLAMAKDAAKPVVSQLAFADRVSVVVMNGSAVTPPGCQQRLLAATKRNSDVISAFIDSVTVSAYQEPGLDQGFQKAYSLLQVEKSSLGRKDTNDVIILLTNGEYVVLNEEEVFRDVKEGQYNLNKAVTHLIYVIRSHTVTPARDLLYQLADLNNLQLMPGASSWPPNVYMGPVGPVGKVELLRDSVAFNFKYPVGEFYQFFPKTGGGNVDRVSVAPPQKDSKVGLIVTMAAPVYNSSTKDPSTLHGAAAVDVSMTSLFDDVIHFKWRLNSYSFVVERERGLVLIHPKLENPSKLTDLDPIFASLEVMEPTLTSGQRDTILAANSAVLSFDAQIIPGRSNYKTGMDFSEATPSPARVLYSLIPDTDYVLVAVIFLDELVTQPVAMAPHDLNLGLLGAALSQQPPQVSQPGSDACVSADDARVMDKVTVKLSPEVYTDPELFMHSKEQANNMSQILRNDGYLPTSLRPELLVSVIGDLKVVSSLKLSLQWRDSSDALGVVGRLMGTWNGVFAAYPANTFAEEQYAWYRQSLARPGSLWLSLRRSATTNDKRVVISTTVGDGDRIFGVVGATVARRSLAALFYNTVTQCLGTAYSCHLLSHDGYFLDVLSDTSSPPQARQRHLTSLYPWLANELLRRQIMKPVWCTTFSRGQHSLTYILHVPEGDGVTHDAHAQNLCRHFLLYHVTNSNLFVLSLINRVSKGCVENTPMEQTCSSCTGGPQGFLCAHCTPTSSRTSSSMTSPCQCPCSCDVDFCSCQDSYRHSDNASVPMITCYVTTAKKAEGHA